MSVSRDLGTGFAAPYEFAVHCMNGHSPQAEFFAKFTLRATGGQVGAGMMPYGYALAASCEARNFVAVEPFYADKQKASVKAMIEMPVRPYREFPQSGGRISGIFKRRSDDLLCVVACGIEDCILPGAEYRKKWKVKSTGYWNRIHSSQFAQ